MVWDMFEAMSSFSTFDRSPRRFQVTNILLNKVQVQCFPSNEARVSQHVLARYAFRDEDFSGWKCLLYRSRCPARPRSRCCFLNLENSAQVSRQSLTRNGSRTTPFRSLFMDSNTISCDCESTRWGPWPYVTLHRSRLQGPEPQSM